MIKDYSVIRAVSCAYSATETARRTGVSHGFSLVRRRTLNPHTGIGRDKLDQPVRANLEAFSAGNAERFINYRLAVLNLDRVMITDLGTGAVAKATEFAGVIA